MFFWLQLTKGQGNDSLRVLRDSLLDSSSLALFMNLISQQLLILCNVHTITKYQCNILQACSSSKYVAEGLDTNILVPVLWSFLDKLGHQVFALLVVEVHHLNSQLANPVLGPHKSLVLSHHHTLDSVHNTGAGAHGTWRQSGVHGAVFVNAALETTSVFQRRDLTMQSGRVLLETQVVATAENSAVFTDQGSTNRNSAFFVSWS